MPKKYLIVLFFMAFAGARHAVPLQGLPLLSDMAFAATQENGQPCPPECVTDSMEIITYYPSPYGYYEELRGDKIIVGDSDNSYIDETNLPPKGTITFEPMLDDPDASDGNLYEGSLYYQGAIGGTKGKFRFYDGIDWQDLGAGGDYWKPSTANTNDIYYNTGNVGIGVGAGDTIGAKLQLNPEDGQIGLVVRRKSGSAAVSYVSKTYSTPGSYSYPVPSGVFYVNIQALGAQGGRGGGLGGRAVATVAVTPEEILSVYVGGSGEDATGGWNGGGNGGSSGAYYGAGGGGASDVRRGGTKIIVAGGGGGPGWGTSGGGGGGDVGYSGGSGSTADGFGGGPGGGGGTQKTGGLGGGGGGAGSLGVGGIGGSSAGTVAGGGGGGGYYGGGGGAAAGGSGTTQAGSGGGGSGYVTGTGTIMTNGVQSGNGKVIIQAILLGSDNLTEWQDESGTIMNIVDVSGNLALGSSSATGYRLNVNGPAYSTVSWSTSSDLRFKENILPLNNSLDKILSLQGVSFEWNKARYPQMNFEDNRQIGLIGQAVEKILPEIVHTDSQGYKSIAYDKLGAVTIEAIKEQQKEIEQLKESLRGQEEKSRENQERLRKQQKEIELLKAEKL